MGVSSSTASSYHGEDKLFRDISPSSFFDPAFLSIHQNKLVDPSTPKNLSVSFTARRGASDDVSGSGSGGGGGGAASGDDITIKAADLLDVFAKGDASPSPEDFHKMISGVETAGSAGFKNETNLRLRALYRTHSAILRNRAVLSKKGTLLSISGLMGSGSASSAAAGGGGRGMSASSDDPEEVVLVKTDIACSTSSSSHPLENLLTPAGTAPNLSSFWESNHSS